MTLGPAWVIAKREFLERVRSRWFVIMTVLWPFLMVGMIVLPALLAGRGTAGAKVEVADRSGMIGDAIATALAQDPARGGLGWTTAVVPSDAPESELRRRIQANEINGFVVVAADALDTGDITYSGDNASNQTVQIGLQRAVSRVLLTRRAEAAEVTPAQLARLLAPIDVKTRHTTGEEEGQAGVVAFLLGYMLAFLIYIAITLYGINVMRSVVTEKASRVVELMVAATKPRALMTGKILGVGAAGLSQIAIWMVIGGIALAYQDAILGAFGAAGRASDLPSLTIDQIAVTLACFVLGYLFYSAMYAAVGAMVSSEQDSQQAQMPITMLLVIGIISMQVVTNDPRGAAAEIATMVPFWSPMLMPLRYFLGGATAGQVALCLGILAISTYVVARAAAKIFRVGILMYGKRPSLRELVRWLRY
jgi:ABC-2 type transport system permease protein